MTDGGESPVSGRGEPIRVLIVDDHELIRRSLALALAAEADIEVVGEASDGQEAVELADRLMPDVALMDVRMPRQDGIEATKGIKASVPSTRIIMLTVSDEEEDLFEAIKAGATGYLLKDVQINDVPDAVRGVHEGQSLINPAMAAKLITEFANMSRKEAERPPQLPVPRLTDREMEVLRLVAKGMNNREIAKQLFISENTVKNHVRNILDKLQLHSRMEAVVYAVRERMLEIT
ncbi:response regulator transcription factor [Nonomuraea longicatena]|uniref:Response regulator transcription factor n=1 Tax=Nonomuraea longicatena TaxID=83682 RepID=A0ABP3ZXC8_9ACTN